MPLGIYLHIVFTNANTETQTRACRPLNAHLQHVLHYLSASSWFALHPHCGSDRSAQRKGREAGTPVWQGPGSLIVGRVAHPETSSRIFVIVATLPRTSQTDKSGDRHGRRNATPTTNVQMAMSTISAHPPGFGFLGLDSFGFTMFTNSYQLLLLLLLVFLLTFDKF